MDLLEPPREGFEARRSIAGREAGLVVYSSTLSDAVVGGSKVVVVVVVVVAVKLKTGVSRGWSATWVVSAASRGLARRCSAICA